MSVAGGLFEVTSCCSLEMPWEAAARGGLFGGKERGEGVF